MLLAVTGPTLGAVTARLAAALMAELLVYAGLAAAPGCSPALWFFAY